MSRMDRYKHIHEESEEKKNIFARKEIHHQETEQAFPPEQEEWEEPVYQERPQTQPSFAKDKNKKKTKLPKAPKQGKKPKRKRKHPILSFLLKLILILAIYSGVAFAAGKMVASNDDSVTQETETFNGFASSDGSNNILLLGSDSREGENARSDSIMVLQLDGPSKKPKLLSFMRDTYVDIPGVGQNKLNAAYAYGGAELVRKTLSQNFGIDCKYYTMVDFKTFEKVIDTLFPSGVQIDAEKDMSKNIEVAIKKGPQKMDGLTLLQYARFRMDEEGDFGRVRRQQQVMNGIFSELKNPLAIAKLPYAAGKVMGYAATDLPMSFLLKNTLSMAKGAGGIDRLTVPVDDSWSYGNTWEAGSVLVIDQDMNKKAITEFLAK
ncbi:MULTISPECIES: LCP family protein [Enterococcus]|uniref:LCP family protein n=1 Tax=Enterococcus TaxID=1350 RepID=UPI0010F6B7D9|nr:MULTISPECIES: LCP family protein [Enterococcus]KAF1302515.1 transcriptional regulator [Enterococcus sp. JM9B]